MNKEVEKLRNSLRKYPILYNYMKFHYRIFHYFRFFPQKIRLVIFDWKKVSMYKNLNSRTCWLMCTPIHANLGDQAMAYAAEKWIRANYSDYRLIKMTNVGLKSFFFYNLFRLSRIINPNDIVFIQGGYTTGDQAYDEQTHRIIAKRFTNKIIFFPQTVYYQKETNIIKTASYYNAQKKILFLARDTVSYNSVNKYFSGIKVSLFPDIVSSLIENEDFRYDDNKNGVLFCFRNDAEKKYSKDELENLYKTVSEVVKVDETDLIYKGCIAPNQDYYDIIKEYIYKFSGYRIVITDRFHGILFSILAHTSVIAIDSIDFKVREGASMFGLLLPNSCFYAETISEVPGLISQLLSNDVDVKYTDVCNIRYYSMLKQIINEL